MKAVEVSAHPFYFSGKKPEDLLAAPAKLAEIFHEYGILYFPGLLAQDWRFIAYVDTLKRLTQSLFQKIGHPIPEDKMPAGHALDDLITLLAQLDRSVVGALYDIGTRPNKLLDGNVLKLHPAFIMLVQKILGEDAIIASPSQSDLLHIFPPGEGEYKNNLPLHQDYPYIMQSPEQLTIFINLSSHCPESGGVSVYPRSHKLGVAPCRRGDYTHFEIILPEGFDRDFQALDMALGYGDVAIFHSLLFHRSIRNTTTDQTRIVQLFRYSNINNDASLKFNWGSTAHHEKSTVAFETMHPDLYRTAAD